MSIEKLMTVDNVLAAFKFSAKGELQDYQLADGSEFEQGTLDLLCHVCVANMAIASMQARGWESMTQMQGFYPVSGISLIGFDWTVISNNEYGVVVPNDKVDFDQTYQALDALI